MKKLVLSFWLALAAAGLFVAQSAMRADDPAPTCPPECPGQGN